jgi:hypothetical protein
VRPVRRCATELSEVQMACITYFAAGGGDGGDGG